MGLPFVALGKPRVDPINFSNWRSAPFDANLESVSVNHSRPLLFPWRALSSQQMLCCFRFSTKTGMIPLPFRSFPTSHLLSGVAALPQNLLLAQVLKSLAVVHSPAFGRNAADQFPTLTIGPLSVVTTIYLRSNLQQRVTLVSDDSLVVGHVVSRALSCSGSTSLCPAWLPCSLFGKVFTVSSARLRLI